MDTERKILDKALELFNEKGVESVGMRELATALDIRIGNLTYYFPTKDELVYRLSEQYSASNTVIHSTYAVHSLLDFLKKQSHIFENMLAYRCLMLSMVHLIEQNQFIATYYEKIRKTRGIGLEENMKALYENKYLKLSSSEEIGVLVSINSLLGRFWMSEAIISGKRAQLQKQKTSYLRLMAFIFKPYATKKGLKDIDLFIESL